MPSKSVPQCEHCYIEANGEFDMDTLGFEGSCREIAVQRLVSIRMPVVVTWRRIERCFFCGNYTVVGIYVETNLVEPAILEETP